MITGLLGGMTPEEIPGHYGLTAVEYDTARLLLGLLIAAFAPGGPLVPGIDDTFERRRGKCIAAPRAAPPPAPSETDRKGDGIYRDPVRSSHGSFVKARGLRWLSLMLLAPVPWAKMAKAPATERMECQRRGCHS